MCFRNWHEEFSKFSPEHVQKSRNCDFYWIFLTKVENVWAWNLQGSYVSWQWWMMENLKRNWLVSSKLIWGIWQMLIRALENLKDLHFKRLLLTKVYNIWVKKVHTSYVWWLWVYWLVLSKMTRRIWQIFVHRLKNSDFILESKKSELN